MVKSLPHCGECMASQKIGRTSFRMRPPWRMETSAGSRPESIASPSGEPSRPVFDPELSIGRAQLVMRWRTSQRAGTIWTSKRSSRL